MARRYQRPDTPAGVLAPDLQRAMDVRSAVFLLPRDGISHVRPRHPDVTPEDLVMIQRILDGAHIFNMGGNRGGRKWIRVRAGRTRQMVGDALDRHSGQAPCQSRDAASGR